MNNQDWNIQMTLCSDPTGIHSVPRAGTASSGVFAATSATEPGSAAHLIAPSGSF